MKLTRTIRDKAGTTLRTRDDALRYVLAKLQKPPEHQSWKPAAELLIDGSAAPELITRQIECTLLLNGQLDVAFVDRR